MKLFALIALSAAILSAIIRRGSFGQTITVYVIGIYLGGPVLLFMAAWLLFGFRRAGGVPQGLGRMFFASVVAGGSLGISLGLGRLLHNSEIRAAHHYVSLMVPRLDAYRREHGRYPESLAVFPESRPPGLLQNAHGYRTDGDGFQFQYWDSAGMMDGYCFDSSTREWYYFD
jgi:hypothetical protein